MDWFGEEHGIHYCVLSSVRIIDPQFHRAAAPLESDPDVLADAPVLCRRG
jgi:hypothetical protein